MLSVDLFEGSFCRNLADSLELRARSLWSWTEAHFRSLMMRSSALADFSLACDIISNASEDSRRASIMMSSIILLGALFSRRISTINWLLIRLRVATFSWSQWHLATGILCFLALNSRLALRTLRSLLTLDSGLLAFAGTSVALICWAFAVQRSLFSSQRGMVQA